MMNVVCFLKKVMSGCLDTFKAGRELNAYKMGTVTHDGNCGIHSLQVCVNRNEDQDQAINIRAHLKNLFKIDGYNSQTDPVKHLIRAEIKEMVLGNGSEYCQGFKYQRSYQESVDKIAELNQKVEMQRWSLINNIFGTGVTYGDISTLYSQWVDRSTSSSGSSSSATKSRVKTDLKELFFEALKQAIETENTRRVQSGNAPMTIDSNAIQTVFKDAIEQIEIENDEFNGVKNEFLRNHKDIKTLSNRLQSDEMAEAFIEWNTNFENLFGDEIEKPGYYLSRWSMALVAHQLNCNMQLVLGCEGSYETPEEYRVVLKPGEAMNYVHFNGVNAFNPMVEKGIDGSSSRSGSPNSVSSTSTETDRVLDPRLNEIFGLQELELYPYQIQAIKACLRDLNTKNKSLLIAATGLGKTIMTYVTLLIRALTHPGELNIVLNNQTALVKQLSDEYAYKLKCPLPLIRYLGKKYEQFDHANGKWVSVRSKYVEARLKEGGFYFSTVQSFLTDKRKVQWKSYKQSGVKVDTVFFDEAHHLGEGKKSEPIEESEELGREDYFIGEAQEVGMGNPNGRKRRKKEIVSNEWTKTMAFLQYLYKCNILGCTATPKGPTIKTSITTVFGTPSIIVPIQNGVYVEIIHDPNSIKTYFFSPILENTSDSDWDDIVVLNSSDSGQTKKRKVETPKGKREKFMKSYLSNMYPGVVYQEKRSEIIQELETEGLFDKEDWPNEMETVKKGVVGNIKTWLESKPTESPRRTIVFCKNKAEAEVYQEGLNTQLNESAQKNVYVGLTHDGVSLEEDAKIEQQFKAYDGHSFLLVVGRKGEGCNIPEIDTAIWLKGSGAFAVQQQVGRLLRKKGEQNGLECLLFTNKIPMNHVLEWLKTDGMYAQLEREQPRSCKRNEVDAGSETNKKPRTNAPHTNVNPQVGIEGYVCHAKDPDKVRTVSVETQCLSSLLGATLDSASYISFLKTKFPGMIRIFESRTLLGNTALAENSYFVQELISKVEKNITDLVYQNELEKLESVLFDPEIQKLPEEYEGLRVKGDVLKVLTPLQKGRLSPVDIDSAVKELVHLNLKLLREMDREELNTILQKLTSLIEGLKSFQNSQFQADSELYQVVLRLAHTKGYTQSWFSALNQAIETETEDDQKKREETNCVEATASFIRCLKEQKFERAGITGRIKQVENEDGTWTYNINGEEKVFTPVMLDGFNSIKGDGVHFQLKAIVRKQNEEDENDYWHMSGCLILPNGQKLYMEPQLNYIGDELNPFDSTGAELFVCDEDHPIYVYDFGKYEQNPLAFDIKGFEEFKRKVKTRGKSGRKTLQSRMTSKHKRGVVKMGTNSTKTETNGVSFEELTEFMGVYFSEEQYEIDELANELISGLESNTDYELDRLPEGHNDYTGTFKDGTGLNLSGQNEAVNYEKTSESGAGLNQEQIKTTPQVSSSEGSDESHVKSNDFRAKPSRFKGYQGEVNSQGQPHGQGRLVRAGGSVYQGQFEDGKFSGLGEYVNRQKKFTYIGEFIKGIPHGLGKKTYKDGAYYNGKWSNGMMHGNGIMNYKDGFYFSGEWKASRPCNGRGKLRDGENIFEGDYRNGKPWNGSGTYNYPDGDVYEGEWKNGKRNGQGKLTYKGNSFYEGAFEDDKFHGQGKLTYPDGRVCEGEWKDGNPWNGQGTYKYSNAVYEGELVDGKKWTGVLYHPAAQDGSQKVVHFKEGQVVGVPVSRLSRG